MYFLLSLLSAVAVLAYAVSVTKSSVLRACGTSLGNIVNHSLNSRFKALTVGLITTMLLQSSTATSLLVSSFLKKGILSLGVALTIMLGADLGTAVMARILTYDLSILCPLLLTIGATMHTMSEERPKVAQIGGIVLGLGLILLALSLIVKATEPVISSELTSMLLKSLAGEITFSLLLGMLLAVLCYSSLAAVLLTSLLSASGFIEPQCAVSVVIGANLGSCFLEILGALRQGLIAKRVMFGNTIFKLTIALLCLPLLPLIALLQEKTLALSDFVIWFHVGFNFTVCLFMLPCVNLCSKLMLIVFPETESPQDPDKPKHLDKNAYINPSLALGNATREILSVGDFLQTMLRNLNGDIMMNNVQDETDWSGRIKGLAQNINEYLSGIVCDTGKQRQRMRQCLIASVGLGEGAKLIKAINKEVMRINTNTSSMFSQEDRKALIEISKTCGITLELALNAFIYGGKKQNRSFYASRAEFQGLTDSYSSLQLKRQSSDKFDAFFSTNMLKIVEHFRQLGTIFDSLFNMKGGNNVIDGSQDFFEDSDITENDISEDYVMNAEDFILPPSPAAKENRQEKTERQTKQERQIKVRNAKEEKTVRTSRPTKDSTAQKTKEAVNEKDSRAKKSRKSDEN